MHAENECKGRILMTAKSSGEKIRVAAYCRVSTDKDDQVNSLESQKRYFSEYICRTPCWELVEVYADEGVTGTSTQKRSAFNRMIDDASKHRFSLIITKEISRFARNTLDSIFYTRKLKEWGVGVIFMNDNINTLDADSELRLTIMSSIAQEESRKTSDRVKWGQKRRMEQGVVFGRSMLGYDVTDGKIKVNEDGAETVRLIFRKFLFEGKGTHVIARELKEEGIETASYMKSWSNTAILRILRNEKYCGDLVQKKTYTPSYLDHLKRCNKGEEDYVIIRNHHEAIISRDVFEKTAKELQRRGSAVKYGEKYSTRYCFSGKLKCGLCGKSYVSLTKKRRNSSTYKAWRCSENAKNGTAGCDNVYINDDALKELLIKIISETGCCALNQTKKIIKETVIFENGNIKNEANSISRKIASEESKKKRLIELYIEGAVTKKEFEELSSKYNAEIKYLQDKLSKGNAPKQTERNIESDIYNALEEMLSGGTWDDDFYGNILEKIVVYKHGIEVKLYGCDDIFAFSFDV